MRDEDLAAYLRAGMGADEPPADLVDERVSSLRSRLEGDLFDPEPTPDAPAHGDTDDLLVIELDAPGERPDRDRRWWARGALALAAAAAIIIGLLVVGSQGDDETRLATEGGAERADPAECAAGLELTSPGLLTVATTAEGSAPWRFGDASQPIGFEPALVTAVAQKLGFAEEEIDWDQVGFQAGTGSGRRFHDIFIDAVTITDERADLVDFSLPYYDVELAVIAMDDSILADATSLADLREARLVAATLSSASAPTPPGVSVDAAQAVVASPEQVTVFDTLDAQAMLSALASGSADGMIVDLPTARFVTGDLVDQAVAGVDASVVAVLPGTGSFERLGMVLEIDSPLTRCVDLALAELRQDGTIADLETEWLREGGTIPTLTE